MSQANNRLELLRKRISAQDGTVLNSVEGEVELNDVGENGEPRKGPVLVLQSIEQGAQLKLAHPRAVTVLGSVSGQVFGAYRVKAGNLLSGRFEGTRHVEIVHNFGSKGDTNEDSWIVFEATSDPGFFNQAQQGLEHLRELELQQQPQRESTARHILLNSLKDVPYDTKVFVRVKKQFKVVVSVYPARRGKEVQMNLKALLRYVLFKAEAQKESSETKQIEGFKTTLKRLVLVESVSV